MACPESTAWSISRTAPSGCCRSIVDGRIWLVGQHRYPLDAYSWEIPEGGSPESETPEATALRELREETGLTAGRIELVATSHLSNAVSDELGYVFRATDLTQGPDEPEGCERIVARCFEWDEAWAMLRRGEITDSLTVIALLHEAVRRLEPARSVWDERLPCGASSLSSRGCGLGGWSREMIEGSAGQGEETIGMPRGPKVGRHARLPWSGGLINWAGKNLPGQTVWVDAKCEWVEMWLGSMR